MKTHRSHKKYEPVKDVKRQELIELIYEKGMNISQAAKVAGIYYPTAKSINKIYLNEKRTCKKIHRDRSKTRQKKALLAAQRAKTASPRKKQDFVVPDEAAVCQNEASTAPDTENLAGDVGFWINFSSML